MLLAHFLWIWTWIFLATNTATAHLDTQPSSPTTTSNPHPHLNQLTRLERLETILADHQAQYRHDRDAWEKESRMLRKNLRRLQGDVLALQREKREMRKEIGALQNAQALFQALSAENKALKSQMEHLQNAQSLSQKVLAENQALKSHMDHLLRLLDSKGIPGQSYVSDGPQPLGQQSGQSGQAVNTSQPAGSGQQNDDPSPGIQRSSHPVPVRRWSSSEIFRQHVQSARSDDQGPLQVVVDHLAATTNQLTSDVQAVSSNVQNLRSQMSALQAAQGSTFVQWGSSTCSGASELVYTGAMGGAYYNDPGGAANTLCLSLSPKPVTKPYTNGFAAVHGTEYETADSHQDTNALCAVCRTQHPTTIMVPGTNVCGAGWTLMYSGYLMAGAYNQHASEYICVDSKMEGAMGSNHNENGRLLYFTKTYCSTLSCPPYENYKVVTCAVCSK